MLGQLQTWLCRRWYRSLLPIIVLAVIASPLIEVLTGLLRRAPDQFMFTCLMGLVLGMLAATFSATVVAIAAMQMAASMRAMIVAMFSSSVILATLLTSGQPDISQSCLVDGLLVFLVVMAFVTRTSLHGDAGLPHQRLSGPRSREMGVSQSAGDRFLMFAVLFLVLEANYWRHATEGLALGQLTAWALSSVLFGIASTLAVLGQFRAGHIGDGQFGDGGRWGIAAALVLACASFTIGRAAGHRLLDISLLAWSHEAGLMICALCGWTITLMGLSRFLRAHRWRWKRTRQKVIAFADGQMNLTATDRLRDRMQRGGWVSIAGILSITLFLFLPFGFAAEIASDGNFPSAMMPANFSSNSMEFIDAIEGMCVLAILGCMLASFSAIAIVATHHFSTLIFQTIVVGVCYVCLVTSQRFTSGDLAGLNLESIVTTALIAFPVVVITRMMIACMDRIGRFRIGVRFNRKRSLQIRSIMALTFLVGIEMTALNAVLGELVLEEIAFLVAASILGFVFLIVSMIWLRRQLGQKTWSNGLTTLSLIVLPIGATIYALSAFAGLDWLLNSLFAIALLLSFVFTIQQLADWLRIQGWAAQRKSQPDT